VRATFSNVHPEATLNTERITTASRFVDRIVGEMERSIVGQRELVEGLLVGLLAGGHILLEGVPGLAKTMAVRTLAATIRSRFQRIQFTPDLLPADLIGTMIYNQKTGDFGVQHGPVFTNVLLADEINRAPAKVQSALLEAMQERQVTIGGRTYPLEEPFFVLATQNPIEHEGTYPLPEAQVDRFMLKLLVTYPDRAAERAMLDRLTPDDPEVTAVTAVTDTAELLQARELVRAVYVDGRVKEYVLDVVRATREPETMQLAALRPLIEFGVSPRGALYLVRAAQARAFRDGRGYVTPEDVKALGPDVLRHRLILSYEAEAEHVTPDDMVRRILDAVPVP
jgi:MoxR-like ATPase